MFPTMNVDASTQGLFGLLLAEVHVATVSEVRAEGGPFFLKLDQESGVSMTFSQSSSGESMEAKFASTLKAGRAYRFPHCLLDLLGLDPCIQLIRGLPGKPLESVKTEKPFRAVVLDQGLGQSHYSIIVQEAGGKLRHFHGSLDDAADKAAALVLSRGRSFEFPAVLDDVLRTREEREAPLKARDAERAALFRYLGEWSGGMDGNPVAKISMICHPRANGSGIWREVTFSNGDEEVPPLPDIATIAYDASEQGYLARGAEDGSLPPLKSTWDEKTRTFTTVLAADDRGRRRVNTATFTRDDRIDWKTITESQKGEPLASSGGHYDRVRTLDLEEGEPLPPTEYTGVPLAVTSHILLSQQGAKMAPEIRLVDLGTCPPFRAKVSFVSVKDDTLLLQLRHMDGEYSTQTEKKSGIGRSALGKALALLKLGREYEFPYCIHNPGQEEMGKPTTPAMKALESFVGHWSARIYDSTGKLGEPLADAIRWNWSADGTALWRAQISGGNGLVGRFSLTHITYDPVTQEYIETRAGRFIPRSQSRGRWDAEKRTFTWNGDVSLTPPIKGEGARTIATPDRIEWKARQIKADGGTLSESSGVYERISE